MALTNGLQLGYGIQPLNPVPVDSWSGPYSGADEATAKAAANAAITSSIRFQSMEVRLVYGGSAYKYWYKNGISNTDLVEFKSGSTLNSVGLTMPPAFAVANSPLTIDGTLAVTALGVSSQYIRGDGQLATLPTFSGGGSSVNYYLNGSIPASVSGYEQLSTTPVLGTGTDYTLSTDGLIAQFLTDVGDPDRILIPAGGWIFEMFFSVAAATPTCKFYVELLKYDGVTFTSIANSSAVPEALSGGSIIDLYTTSLAVPEYTLLITDRLVIRVYIVDNIPTSSLVTLHTENSHLCEIVTTFSVGLSSLNGLTDNTQYLAVGTLGSDFYISSVADTHTFNLPTASSIYRGALSSADWIMFNGKQDALGFTPYDAANPAGYISISALAPYQLISGLGSAAYEDVSYFQTALTNPVTGTGTPNTLPKFTGTSTIGDSNISDSGSLVTITGDSLFNGNITISQPAALRFVQENAIVVPPMGQSAIDAVSETLTFISNPGSFYKGFAFDTSGITNNSLWYYSMPNANGTLALTSDIHNPVTIGTANGLSLIGQELSLGLSSSSSNGALSQSDWIAFNGKQTALNGTGFVKISGTTISYDNNTYVTSNGTNATSPIPWNIDISGTANNANYWSGLEGYELNYGATYSADVVNLYGLNDGLGVPTKFDATAVRSFLSLSNAIIGSGLTNYVPKFNGVNSLTNSLIYDNGTYIGIGTTTPATFLNIYTANSNAAKTEMFRMEVKNSANTVLDYFKFTLGATSARGGSIIFGESGGGFPEAGIDFNLNHVQIYQGGAYPIYLRTNNTNRVTVTGTGTVLMNQTTDDLVNKLQLTGNAKITSTSAAVSATLLTLFSGSTFFTGSNDANTGYSLNFDAVGYGSGNFFTRTGGQIQMLKTGSWNRDISGTSYSNLVFSLNNSATNTLIERMRLSYTGNLLLGSAVDDLTNKLQVTGGSIVVKNSGIPALNLYRDLDVTVVGAAGQGIQFGARSGSTFIAGAAIYGNLSNPATTGSLNFQTLSGGSLVTRLIINSEGNVGIANTSPSQLLTVGLTGGAVKRIYIPGTYNFDGAYLSNYDANGGGKLELVAHTGVSTSASWQIANNNDTYAQSLTFSRAAGVSSYGTLVYGAPSMLITQEGNVGIGTTPISQKLEVNGNALIKTSFVGTISAFGDNYASFSHVSRAGTNEYSILSENNGTTYVNASTGQNIKFRINNFDKAILDSSGNFGIGTISPTTKLTIQRAGGDFGVANGIGFTDQAGILVAGIGVEGAATNDMQIMGSVGIRFYTNSNLSSTNERMRIDTSGNVGINTISPSYKLDVAGRALVDQFQYTRAVDITGTDLNGLQTAGFYNGSTLTNAPEGGLGWYWITVERYTDNDAWVHQTATSFGSGNTANLIYTRVRSSGTWGSWKQLGDTAGISGNDGYIAKFTSTSTVGNSIIYNSGTNVGIGTTIPSQKLTVVGNISIDGTGNSYALKNAGSQCSYYGVANGPSEYSWISAAGDVVLQLGQTGGYTANRLIISNQNNGDILYTFGTTSTNDAEKFRMVKDGTFNTVKVAASTSISAPIYYDSDSTAYYVNPASTTVLNTLQVNTQITAPIYYDSNNVAYFVNPASTSVLHTVNAAFSITAPIYYDTDNTAYFINMSSTFDSIRVAGDIVAYYSDERLKDKKGNIENPLEKVLSLNGFYYEPNEKAQQLGYIKRMEVGVSAQEVEAVMPEIIKDAAIGYGYKTLDYAKLIPLLIEAIKEQQTQIEELKTKYKFYE